jgi:hypothetical protein
MLLMFVLADASLSPDTNYTRRPKIYNDSTLPTNWHASHAELHSGNGNNSRRYPHKLTGALPQVLAPLGRN